LGLDDTLLILKRKTEGITIDRRYDPALPHIEAYGSELNQVWTNLIDNAADAIAGSGRTGGRIEVRAFPVADGVVVEVEDNGPGIPDDVLPRIFDAFFTTKPPGSGTGLGLEITQGIVFERHGGEITVQSEPGRTVFRVELPLRPPK
jgi:signal transduction histidine kinase